MILSWRRWSHGRLGGDVGAAGLGRGWCCPSVQCWRWSQRAAPAAAGGALALDGKPGGRPWLLPGGSAST